MGPTVNQNKALANVKNKSGFERIEAIWSDRTGSPRLIRGFRGIRINALDQPSFFIDKEQVRRLLTNIGARDDIISQAVGILSSELRGLFCQDPSDFCLAPLRIDLDARYRLTIRLQQTVKNGGQEIPVHRYGLAIHLPDTVSISRITGQFASKVARKTPAKKATDIPPIVKKLTYVQKIVPGKAPVLTYLPQPSGEYPLAWRCLVKMPTVKGKWTTMPTAGEVFIDDETGDVLRLTNLISAFNGTPCKSSGVPYYPKNQQNTSIQLQTVKRGSSYYLEDTTQGNWSGNVLKSGLVIRTKICRCAPGADMCSCTPLSCPDDCTRQNACPVANDPCPCGEAQSSTITWDRARSVEAESHANSGMFFEFMNSKFGHHGLSVEGPEECEICVYHNSASTSFFYPPGVYSDLPYRIYIPSCTEEFDAFCFKDIIAHEWTHAMIDALYGPEGTGYEGAICEGLCNAFASFFLGYEKDPSPWKLGRNWRKTNRVCYRNMASPRNGDVLPLRKDNLVRRGNRSKVAYVRKMVDLADSGVQPDHFESRVDPDQDPVPRNLRGGYDALNGWARINSGIINKATFLLCDGGEHGPTNAPKIKVHKGIGMDLLSKLYYRMLGLSTCSSFEDMRDELLGFLWDEMRSGQGWLQSQGLNDPRRRIDYLLKVTAIVNAFSAVGVPEGDPGVSLSPALVAAGESGTIDPAIISESDSVTRGIRNRYPAVEFPDWF